MSDTIRVVTLTDEQILEIGYKHFKPGHNVKAESSFVAAVRDVLTASVAELALFVNDVAKQTPEKPDHWSACGQCERNIDRAQYLLEAGATYAGETAADGWVRVSDRLPPLGRDVLVAIEFFGPGDWRIKVGALNDRGQWCVFGGSWTPTHWMLVPPSPGVVTCRAPAAADAREGLTDEQIDMIANDGHRNAAGGIYATSIYDFARACVAATHPGQSKPLDMQLFCPKCGVQHIDHAEPAVEHEHGAVEFDAWDNPPHRSHLCHTCGTIWRPADVPTNGVAAIETRGKADTWNGQPEPRAEVTDADIVTACDAHGITLPVEALEAATALVNHFAARA
ncbi:DUF551 domain-containing protein [Burkholderia sp. BCC1972]|uniref:DUF551 domain-containing protein n=1 Tax=Burkholderia sp. BCC1972 TaxID=2817438 RepID=UPI002ABE87F5|nr:DUF551 domain-containing protein [Burkholderia sp. BCC1972]